MQTKDRHREYNLKFYHNKRNAIIQKLGGKCAVCGSTENLEFDHINSSEKEHQMNDLLASKSIDAANTEAKKCQLLCQKCHIKKTKECGDNNSKINGTIALQICTEYATSDIKQKELATKYNLALRTISSIINGERWKDETQSVDRSIIKARHKTQKDTIMVDAINPLTDNIYATYSSMSEAEKYGFKSGAISKCCRGIFKQHKGFIWQKHYNS